jgi:Mn-dependent DtxR family transcriptional regulator
MSLDRLPGHELQMTHEQIAVMLGVRRESVTQAALKLQMIGAIQYSRGHIAVLDREELENIVCECYTVVNNEYERLLCNHSSATAGAAVTQKTREELWSVS